ncbi:MAG: fatty acid desaturase [Alphaproteobacteria bacterium]|nr:MAG: fatty acid desaturase [Alphaproteobacteria bacterium]
MNAIDRHPPSDPARTGIDITELSRRLRAYTRPDNARAAFEFVVTAIPFAALWWLAAELTVTSRLAGLAASAAAAAFLVRLFVIQHDCGHRAFFSRRWMNDMLGRLLGVLTFTPYAMWRRNHSLHHSTSGNLDRRRDSDIRTLTVNEYRALSPLGRLGYRLYRNPLTILGLGPAWVFLLKYRLPIAPREATRGDWISTMTTNAAIAGAILGMGQVIGVANVLWVHVPIILFTATAGIWLFYVQHQFETTLWDRPPGWDMRQAAFWGSSHYDLPGPLRWLTGHIGVHHVHHLSSRIPLYRLGQVLRDFPQVAAANRITLREGWACARRHLWDEERRRLVTFAEAARAP